MFKDLNKNNFNKSLNEDHETQNVWWNGEHNQEMKVEINKEKNPKWDKSGDEKLSRSNRNYRYQSP